MLKRFCDMKECPREGLSYRIGSREFDLCAEHIKQIEEWAAENLEGGRAPEESPSVGIPPLLVGTYPLPQAAPTLSPPNSQPGLTGTYPTYPNITWVSANVQEALPEGITTISGGLQQPLPMMAYAPISGVFHGDVDSNWIADVNSGVLASGGYH